jgi:hypothetical protein
MKIFFELLPVALAFVVALLAATSYTKARRNVDRAVLILSSASAVMLIIAQTSWYSTLTGGGFDDPTWVNDLWTVFNTTVMSAFIANALGRRK